MKKKIAVIILTFNEELNLKNALKSVQNFADEIFIVDSFSTDNTIKIAEDFNCKIVQKKFINYSTQRNFALDKLDITSEWVIFLDADEWLTEALRLEIKKLVNQSPIENGFFIKRRLIWMGAWIRHGYYPSWQLRLFRHGYGRCEDRIINEHFIVQGGVGRLSNDMVDENHKDISEWIAKHNDYSTKEAHELFNSRSAEGYIEIKAGFFGGQAQRRRWLRYHIWNNLPLFIRPFLYFFYRYFLLFGFLDGKKAFLFHFMQALWYPMLIDTKYIELMARQKRTNFIYDDNI